MVFVISIYVFMVAWMLFNANALVILFLPFVPGISFLVLAYDEGSRWHNYNSILPVSRTVTVIEKYVLLLMNVFSYVIFLSILLYVLSDGEIIEAIKIIPGMLLLGLTSALIAFPFFFKGKAKKTLTIWIIASIIFLPTETKVIANHENDYLIAIFTVLLFICSMLLSISFYKKREF